MGVVQGKKIFELEIRTSMVDLLALGAKDVATKGSGYALGSVILHAPVPHPGKVVAAIVNTKRMLGGDDIRLDRPRLDMKAPSTVVGNGEKIAGPSSGIRPEVELAAIIGKRLSRAAPDQAHGALSGFTVLNDVTSPRDSKEDAYEAYRRDRATGKIGRMTIRGPLFRSKNHDAFCPMGPWVVTADEIGPTDHLWMKSSFDGRLVQDGSTSEYIFSPEEIASYVSGFLTLEPGDVISCGSVGWTNDAGASLDATEFVLPRTSGQLEVEIENIGRLSNPVVPEDTLHV